MKNSINYTSLLEKANRYGESRDCAVKAVAIVLNTSYEDAHTLLKKFGRKDREGTNFFETTKPALESRGFKIKKIQKPGFIKTISNLENNFYKYSLLNPVLIITSRHILGFINGKAHDFTSGRRHRIISMWEVIPTEHAIFSKEVSDIKVEGKVRKKEDYKYALVHKDTGKVYIKLKRLTTKFKRRVELNLIWITGKKAETIGKLKIVEL